MGAYVTVIGPSDAQVEYRLTGHSGCGLDAALGYYLDAPERPMRWVGRGAAGLGLDAGAMLDARQHEAARALMRGVHPVSGEQLVAPKKAVAPAALLPGVPLLDAVVLEATRLGCSPEALWKSSRDSEEWGRLARGVRRLGAAYRISVERAARLLDAAALPPEAAYDSEVFDDAARHAQDRVVVGNRGYDLTVTLPKSFSVLYAFADPQTARQLEEILLQAGDETFAYAEDIAGYAMRGRHGGGRAARRVAGRGFVGWVNVHRTARPTVDGAPGDPHLHAHYTLANLMQAGDGRWSTVAAGGRDLLAHSQALGEFMNARARRLSTDQLGLTWARDPVTGAWEIAGVGREAIEVFSKRGVQVNELLAALGLTSGDATAAQHMAASQATRRAKTPGAASTPDRELREYWRREAAGVGVDPDRIVADVARVHGAPPERMSEDDLAAAVFDPNTGVTSHSPDFTRRQMLAAIADVLPDGVADSADLERLTDRMLTRAEAVPLPNHGYARHLSNSARFTTRDLVQASDRITATTAAGLHADTAVVPVPVADLVEQVHELANGYPFTAEQRAVYRRLVHAGHQFDVVVGVAGSGKTTVTAAARAAWESHGFTVRGAALAAVGADNLREAGIPSTTIASLLHPNRPLPDKLAGIDVLVLDEASQIGVRQLDVLLAAARQAGTKVVEIGDPKQLGAPVPGGALAAQHHAVAGLVLSENRRQRSPTAQQAAALWRARHFRDALVTWRATGQLLTTETRAQALRAAIAGWINDRTRYADRYDRVDQVLLLATRKADVAELNQAARALARAAGDLGPDHTYRLRGGRNLSLAVGDIVMTRTNDYRTWRGAGPDILNGRRGYVDHIDAETGAVTISWRSGGEVLQATVTRDYVAAGGVEHGYAMTVYKAQGQTVDHAHTYGVGLDAHTTYVAQTRARHSATLYLPAGALVDPTEFTPDAIAAMGEEMRADVVTAILADQAERTREQRLVTDELAGSRTADATVDLPAIQPSDGTGRHPSSTHGDGAARSAQRLRAARTLAIQERLTDHSVDAYSLPDTAVEQRPREVPGAEAEEAWSRRPEPDDVAEAT